MGGIWSESIESNKNKIIARIDRLTSKQTTRPWHSLLEIVFVVKWKQKIIKLYMYTYNNIQVLMREKEREFESKHTSYTHIFYVLTTDFDKSKHNKHDT